MCEACEETHADMKSSSVRKRKKERGRGKKWGEAEEAKRNSLLKLLWFLLRLFLVGDNKVEGILWLLKQSSQFSLDLLSPEDSTNTNAYACPLALLTYVNKRFYDVMYDLYCNEFENKYWGHFLMYNIPVNRLYNISLTHSFSSLKVQREW